MAQHATIAGVNFELKQTAIVVQQLDFINLAPVLAFEFDLEHVAGKMALNTLQDNTQRQNLAGEQGGTGAVVVASRAAFGQSQLRHNNERGPKQAHGQREQEEPEWAQHGVGASKGLGAPAYALRSATV